VLAQPWLNVLDETIEACAAHHRPDLVQQLRQKRAHLLDPTLRVLVIGEAKQGKSQLVNALINASVCAVGDDITTSVPTVVAHADTPAAALIRNPVTAAPRAITRSPEATERIAIPIEAATQINGRAGTSRVDVGRAEIGIPRMLLSSGLVLIDTPAIGYPHSARTADTFAALAQADFVLMTSEATRELSATELDILRQVTKLCPNVVLVLTKIDISPRWRGVAERSRAQLAAAGVPGALIPVSATLRLRAATTNDESLNAESGFPDLIGYLHQNVITNADLLARRAVVTAAGMAVEHLVVPLHAALVEQTSEQTSAAVAELQDAQRRVDELRRRSARWQSTLADEMGDLTSDIEYDLRERTRKILREVDRAFDAADPLVMWETFEDWLGDELSEVALANYTWLIERAEWISKKIAKAFPEYLESLPKRLFEIPEDFSDGMTTLEKPNVDRYTVFQKVFSGFRGSYVGVLMLGLVTSQAGMNLINPISLSAGGAFGIKAVRDEAEGKLKQRQALAKAAAQRCIDDFFLACSKECKDTARHVQGRLRDHFAAVVEELQERIIESARAAQQVAQADAADQERRRVEIRQELERLAALHKRAQMLAATPSAISSTQLEITA
jgi:hypothetical protein